MAQFRERAGVIAEREDNDAVQRNRGLGTALSTAIDKEAAAAARLQALQEAGTPGRLSGSLRSDATLNALEGRAHQIREDLREMERSYTSEFMTMDPRARALRARLAELERQVAQQREVGYAAALQSAREDVAAAQAQVARLRARQAEVQPSLSKVSVRIAEAKVLEDDLAQVDKARREAIEKVTRLEADERRRIPGVTVVEAAAVPAQPWRPDYARDAWLVFGTALIAAALVMAFVEVFNRAPSVPVAGPPTVVVAPAGFGPWLPGAEAPVQALPPAAQGADAARALPAPLRTLSQDETAALLAASRGAARIACTLALMGLTAEEAMAVECGDVGATIAVRGDWVRHVVAPAWLPALLPAEAQANQPWLATASGRALRPGDIESLVTAAVLDAKLPPGVDYGVLRSTCLAWLAAQGVRFSELAQHVGYVSASQMAGLAHLHSGSQHADAEQIDRLMPALRAAPPA